MKNKQLKQLHKLLKAGKSHSGFTLIELLSGLIMSTMVIGGLGYGLFQLTRATRDETNKISARNEASRAIEFISDELRRAENVIDLTTFTPPSGSVPAGATVRLALNIPGIANPVIYSVAPATGNWQGPLVLSRWGPPLTGTGDYSDAPGWANEALIDGLDDTDQTVNCNGADNDYQGFFACRSPEGFTAQLYFTSNIDIANTDYDKQYTADTEVVARARVRDTDSAQGSQVAPVSFKTLGAEYSLGTIGGVSCDDSKTTWTMRNDFFNDAAGDNPTYTPTTWIHDPDRQGQQINIDIANPLTISSIPFIPSSSTCNGTILSRGNESGVDGTPNLHEKSSPDYDTWTPKLNGAENYETSDFTIDFDNPATFNGGDKDVHNPVPIGADGQEVDHVRIFKKGGVIEYKKGGVEIPLDGYDDDSTTTPDDGEYSLGEFLASKGYAKWDGSKYRLVNDDDDLSTNPFLSTDPNAHPHLIKLEDKERIVAIEIGQAKVGAKFPPDYTIKNPGFDLQDNIVLMSVDKFAGEETTHE
ncbi:PilW family protein [Xenococcus sp. PCC 7305]|uniref:PilW family protein n=1 Tax=Xenococcus sp. PCC 7305 TaxID=102125 RepID=UPI0002EF6859|nr:hypothetical protein [Xenococcus sp. PCC 7305]